MSPVRYPCTDSNCALRLRRPTLCPLSYRGGRTDFITFILAPEKHRDYSERSVAKSKRIVTSSKRTSTAWLDLHSPLRSRSPSDRLGARELMPSPAVPAG